MHVVGVVINYELTLCWHTLVYLFSVPTSTRKGIRIERAFIDSERRENNGKRPFFSFRNMYRGSLKGLYVVW